MDYHKYNSNKRSYYGIRNINDRLCYENGLSVITPEKGRKGKSYIEYQTAKTGTSWKGKLKEAVDLLIPQIKDFEELLEKLQASGYEIKLGKYVSCRAPGQERFTRLKTLGIDYTEEAIQKRIAGIRSRNVKIPKQEQGISLLIDIENNIKAQQSAGYEHWAKIHNLKQAAKTMNFLTENNILQYEYLIKKIDEIILDSEQTADSLKQVEKKLSDMAVLIKNISTYQKTKDIHRGYIKAKDKEAYRRKYESSLILYEASGKALKDAGIKKLPELAALQKEYTALQKKKEAIYSDYGKLKRKSRNIKRSSRTLIRFYKRKNQARRIQKPLNNSSCG